LRNVTSALVILDIRVPSIPVAELHGHDQSVNALAWAPHSHCHICSAGDDSQVVSVCRDAQQACVGAHSKSVYRHTLYTNNISRIHIHIYAWIDMFVYVYLCVRSARKGPPTRTVLSALPATTRR